MNTFTMGAVVNVRPWLGVYANRSRTFSLTPPQTQVDGTLSPPTASEGDDFGLRFTLPNGRLAVSVGGFTSYQARESFNMPFNFKDSYNQIAAAPVIGDLSPGGRNNRDVAPLPDNVYSTRTRNMEGLELDVTANLTPQWRLMLNVGKSEGTYSNQSPDIIAYFASQDAVSRAILADAGVLIDAQNNASINPIYNDPLLINVSRVQTAVNGWNTLQDVVIPNTVSVPQPINGLSKWVGNIATDYRFRGGFLKGLRAGFGLNYRGPMILGFRGSDTIVDPNNPNVAIDDPAVDATTPLWSPRQWKTTGSLSYTFKLQHNRTLQLDLYVDNLFDNDDLIHSSAFGGQSATYLRPRTDISSPARETVLGMFSYSLPRNFTFSARLNF